MSNNNRFPAKIQTTPGETRLTAPDHPAYFQFSAKTSRYGPKNPETR